MVLLYFVIVSYDFAIFSYDFAIFCYIFLCFVIFCYVFHHPSVVNMLIKEFIEFVEPLTNLCTLFNVIFNSLGR